MRPSFYAATVAVAVTVGALALPTDERSSAGATATSSGVALLQREIDAMAAAGLPEDDPKVAMLRDDLASFERGLREPAPVEPGVDQVAGSIDAATRDMRVGVADEASLDNGRVDCEPLPGLLTADDVAGAQCSSVLQPDGSNLYVAERPDGTRSAVQFSPDGTVQTVTAAP